MIQLVTGKLGAGKTLFCTTCIFDDLCKGKYVVTNIDIQWDAMVKKAAARRIVLDPRQLFRIDPQMDRNWHRLIPFGVQAGFIEVYLDEIHLFFNSRDWNATSTECRGLLSFLTQSRKACVNITFICQEESTIDKQMRVQAEWLLYIVNSSHLSLGPLGQIPLIKFFFVVKKDAQNGNILEKTVRSYDKSYFGLYRSYAFLDKEMQDLEASTLRLEPLKLQRVPVLIWLFSPILEPFRQLRKLFTPNPTTECASSSSSPS